MTQHPIALPGLAALVDDHDAFVLDIWGVIHDGTRLYPGVVDALDRLVEARKAYVLLTNAPRRTEDVVDMLKRLALPERHRRGIVTSGEATRAAIAAPADRFHADLGRRCFVFGDMAENDLLAGLGLERVPTVEAAEFVVNIGPWRPGARIDDYEADLALAAARDLPMLCANPDLRVMRGAIELICAGALAERFEALGGRVRYHGKPHPEIYETCFALLGGVPKARVIAVGDFLGTDIKGARAAGIASVLVLGGLHARELAAEPGGLARLCAVHGVTPTYTLPGFAW